MDRRTLLERLAIAGAALAAPAGRAETDGRDRLGAVLPKRPLGRCGDMVTCLGLGGFHVGWVESDATAQAIVEKALECGIRFFDTAENYGKGRSEERYGKFLVPRHRDEIYLMTKTQARDAATARQHLENSLRRMKTGMIDLWQLHALQSPEDADGRLEAGVLDEALKAQREGKVRRIGFTGHASPYALARMIGHQAVREACACCQFPVNPVDAASAHSFTLHLLPGMQEAGLGVLAMKTLADGRFFAQKEMNGVVRWTTGNPVVPNALTVEECIGFALSLPVSVLITGAETPELVEEKASMVRRFAGMDGAERLALAGKVAGFAEEGEVEYYKDKRLRGTAPEQPEGHRT